ncbi:MAG: transposase [Balneolales bacterium]
MATREDFKLPKDVKVKRTFSEDFKRKKVQEIERKITRVSEICKAYQVSTTAVYKWIHLYSTSMKKQERLIVESESDTRKISELKQQIAELERALGQKQIQLDFKEKMIEIAEETYQIDIKKKFGGKH